MLLRAASAGSLELRFSTPEGSQAPRGLTGDQGFQAGVYECRLLVDAGKLGGLLYQFIAEDECRTHAYAYASRSPPASSLPSRLPTSRRRVYTDNRTKLPLAVEREHRKPAALELERG